MASDTPAGLRRKSTVTITDLQEKMPAEKAGLKEGDKILALDGKPVPALGEMIESLEVTKDKPITLTVLRNNEQKTFTLQPVLSEKRYRIGIGTMQMKVKTLPFGAAFEQVAGREPEKCAAHPEAGQEDGAAQDAVEID